MPKMDELDIGGSGKELPSSNRDQIEADSSALAVYVSQAKKFEARPRRSPTL